MNEKPAGMTRPTTELLHAEVFEFADQLRQDRLAGAGGQRNEQFGLEVAHQGEDVHAAGSGDQSQYHDDVDDAGGGEQQDQVAELLQAVGAVLGDDGGQGAERADRGQAHDPADDLEHDVRQGFDHGGDGGAVGFGDVERAADQQRHQQRGQDCVAGDRAEQGVGDEVGDELDDADLLAGVDAGDLAGVEGGDVDVHSRAGFEDVGDHQADQHRHQREDEEVAERFDADAAGFAQAVHRGDAEGDDTEDHGDDDHLDQSDEPVVERADCLADVGQQDADGDAEDGADDDLEPELADQGAESGSSWWGGGGGRGHDGTPWMPCVVTGSGR